MTFTNLVQPHKAEEMCEYMNIKSYLLRGIEKCGFIADSVPRGCTGDEGWPLGAGLQEQAPSHLKLLW